MKVVSKNDYRQTNFGSLYYGDTFVTCADDNPCEELYIKTTSGCGVRVQDGECIPFSGSDCVYDVEATIVVNY